MIEPWDEVPDPSWVRRHALFLGISIVALATMLAIFTPTAMILLTTQPAQQPTQTPCDTSMESGEQSPAPAGGDAQHLDQDQRANAEAIINTGQKMQIPARGWLVALAAAMQESRLRNLDHGDRDSLGLFQQRPSQGWGSPAQVLDPGYAATQFYARLLNLPGWQQLPVTVAAQAIQRSAFPGAYTQWTTLAANLVQTLAGSAAELAISHCVPANPSTPLPDGVAHTVISFALSQVGKPYQWGATGPTAYDCSGLILRAFGAASITVPRVSRDQYRAGAHLPVTQAQPGDLVFFADNPADPTTISHVALYVGNQQIIEAAQTGIPVRIRRLEFTEHQLVPTATRPSAAAA